MPTCISYSVIQPDKNNYVSGGIAAHCDKIEFIRQANFDIKIVTPKTEWISPDKGDILLYEDIFNDPYGENGWFSSSQYGELLNTTKPFLMSENAYTACSLQPYADPALYENDLAKFTSGFFTKATKVVVVSKLQLSEIEKYTNKVSHPYVWIPWIDTSIFYDRKLLKRKYDYIYVGAMNFHKGIDIVLNKYAESNLVLVGKNCSQFKDAYPNVTYIDQADPHSVAILLNNSKNFVHFPRWKETFCKALAEAALCGCNIISNNNVGAIHDKHNLSDPNIYEQSKQAFIDMIKSLPI